MTTELQGKAHRPDLEQKRRARLLRRLAEPHNFYEMLIEEANHAGVLRPRSVTAVSLSKKGFALLGSGVSARKLATQHGNQPPGTILLIMIPEETPDASKK